MALQGTIKDFGLPDIFQLIGLQRKTGILLLTNDKDKESVTGYIYEPWHIRFVGKPLAEQVAASGLTLTEFLPKNNLAGGCP